MHGTLEIHSFVNLDKLTIWGANFGLSWAHLEAPMTPNPLLHFMRVTPYLELHDGVRWPWLEQGSPGGT
jgi:hypothetical protein